MTFATFVFLLCLAASLACTALLLRGYLRSRARLLFWAALCFVGLSLNNLLLVLDVLALPDIDLRVPRLAASLAAVLVLLYAFVWEVE